MAKKVTYGLNSILQTLNRIGGSMIIMSFLTTQGLYSADAAPGQAKCRIIPKPVKAVYHDGSWKLTEYAEIRVGSPELKDVGGYLAGLLAPASGFTLPIKSSGKPAGTNNINLAIDATQHGLGEEGYRLDCTQHGVTITAFRPAGIFYGIQTLRQLLPIEVENSQKVKDVEWTVPLVSIEDRPRFKWRGYLLDPSRDFRTIDELKRYIDLLALHKLNIFHLHLTDDQGWRIEIKKYPKLTEVGSRAPAKAHRYYTQDEIRELVRYAAKRYVTIVPEFDIPGHSYAAMLSYPELACRGKLYRGWSAPLCVSQKATLDFCTNVLDELISLFPSKYIHVGADEVPAGPWRACPECKAMMKKLEGEKLPDDVIPYRLKTAHGGLPFHKDICRLQGDFIRKIDKHLTSKGRRMVGWDEIIEGGLKADSRAVVMAWRTLKAVTGAAKRKYNTVVTMHPHYYLDITKISVKQSYEYDPVPAGLSTEELTHILGVQGNMWGLKTQTIRLVDTKTFPRLCAIAETGWTPGKSKDFADFSLRLSNLLDRLGMLGVHVKGRKIGPPNAVSLTTGKPAKCSHSCRGYPAKLANDGRSNDTDQYWATDGKHGTAWWQADLKSPATIGRVVVVCYYGDHRYYGFTVETSLDGAEWEMAADRTTNKEPSTAKGYRCTFQPRRARYIRVTLTHNSANPGKHLVEVMAYRE